MACHSSDFDIFPKLAEHSKKLVKLEEYLSFVIESTQYWQESKYMVKNEIREIFSALSSVIHQREMQLYRQVDELRIDLGSSALNVSYENGSQQRKNGLKCSSIPKKHLSSPCVSPPLKLRFQADIKSLEEAIRSFGCLEIEDGRISEDTDFIFINSEDGLNVEDENPSLHRNDLDQTSTGDGTEASFVVSSASSDSFEILPNIEASAPWSKKKSSSVDHLPLHSNNSERSDVSTRTRSPSVTSSSSCASGRISPNNNASVSWLRKDTNHDTNICCTSSQNVDSSSRARNVGLSSMLPHCFASNGNVQWLRKSDELNSSPTAVLPAKDISSALPFTDAFKFKGNHASMEGFSKLGSRFKSTGILESNKGATDATGSAVLTGVTKKGNPHLSDNIPNSGAVPDFAFAISKFLGNGNVGWLGKDHSRPVANQEAVTDTVKHKSVLSLDGKPFQADKPACVNNIEKSNSASLAIKKMFSPYFKPHDKTIWLTQNPTSSKIRTCS